jgi:hypothetical protein
MDDAAQAVKRVAFWSYAHDDDDRSFGRVLKLADALRNEYALSSGEELDLFVDREGIRWGDAWRTRIDEAVGEVPFFIAVITPTYLKSVECRRELIAFSGRAKSRGLDPLLLPILYTTVPELSPDSSDEVVGLIARTQYADWRKLRNKKLDSEEHMNAVQLLAENLIARRQEVAAIALTTENQSRADSSDELERAVQEIELKLRPWMESVEFDQIASAQWNAARNVRLDRVDRLTAQGAPQDAVYSTLIQLGRELLPIASDRLDKAQSYAKHSIELDPLVDRAIRLVSVHPEKSDLLHSLRDGVSEAWLNMLPARVEGALAFGLPRDIIKFNKHLELAAELLDASFTHVAEANKLVENWRNGLRALDGLAPERMVFSASGWEIVSGEEPVKL